MILGLNILVVWPGDGRNRKKGAFFLVFLELTKAIFPGVNPQVSVHQPQLSFRQ